jgi:hypothetical protein
MTATAALCFDSELQRDFFRHNFVSVSMLLTTKRDNIHLEVRLAKGYHDFPPQQS